MDLVEGSRWAALTIATWHGGRVCFGAVRGALQLASIAVHERLGITRERVHWEMVATVVAVLPPGGTLIDQRSDGARLTLRIPAGEPAKVKGQGDGC